MTTEYSLVIQVYHLIAVVRDVHQPTMSSTSSVTIYIMDANDHAPVWIVPSDLNATLVPLSSYTPVGTPVARVSAQDSDTGDNGRLTYSASASKQRHVLPFDVDPDTGIIRLHSDLSDTV